MRNEWTFNNEIRIKTGYNMNCEKKTRKKHVNLDDNYR